MTKLFRAVLLFFFLTGVVACTTPGYVIQDNVLPIAENRKIINAVIGKPRLVSINGRELYSVYHNRKFEGVSEDKKVPTRFYTKVIILGQRRPYEIVVQVHQEDYEAETETYVDMGLDDSMTAKRGNDIRKLLLIGLTRQQTLDGEAPF